MTPETAEKLKDILKSARPGQREAIEADKPLVVVSAGAGTGKTFTLATRFAWLVATEKADVREILTLTFTEKAASEMQDRIRCILSDWYGQAPDLFPHLEQAIERLDEAYISTIHAFSLRVIRELSLDLELDPASALAGQADEETFWGSFRDALDRGDASWFDGLLTDRTLLNVLEEPRLAALLNDFTPQTLSDLVRRAVGLHGSLGRTPEELLDWAASLGEHDEAARKKLLETLEPAWQEQWELWCRDILPGLSYREKKPTRFDTLFRELLDRWSGEEPPAEEALARFMADLLVETLGKLSGSTSKIFQEADALHIERTGRSIKEFRDSRREWGALARSLFETIDGEEESFRKVLLRLCALGWSAWEGTKKLAGLLTFDDLIRRAIEALARRPDYACRFRHVMVDEFQDTDLRQKILLENLWNPERNALFLVGDLKQSIYRFRHADLSIFHDFIGLARARQALGQGLYINLDCSFRSSRTILDGVNGLFGRLWERGLGASVPHPYEKLEGPGDLEWWPGRQQVGLPGMELLEEFPPAADGGPRPKAGEQRLFLARKLARRIRSLLGKPVWDKRLVTHRPMTLKDVAVLVPRRNWYESLEEAFQEEGLDAYFTGSRSYFARGEFLDILALLRALADPEDAYSLAGYLAGPFSGLGLDEALELLRDNRTDGEDSPLLLEAFAKAFPAKAASLRELRRVALLAGPSEAVRRLLEDAGALLRLPPWTRRRAAANLKRAVEILSEFETARGLSLAGCAAYFGDVARREAPGEEPDVLGEEEDVIRVMTVHASKGLEFPLVALLGLEDNPRRKGGRGSSLTASRDLGIVLGHLPGDDGGETRGKLWHALLEEGELLEEHQRLFYVACTRAQDGLLLGTRKPLDREGQDTDPPEGSWLSWLRAFYPLKPSTVELEGPANRTRIRDPRPAGETVRTMAFTTSQRALSATAYSLLRYCPHAYRMKYRQGFPLEWENPGEERSGGPELGSLAHWILKSWDLTPESLNDYFPADPQKLERLALRLPSELRPVLTDRKGLEELKGWLEDFAASEFALRLRRALSEKALWRELPFTVQLEKGTLLAGAMDVAWKEGDILHVADYKITAMKNVPGDLYDRQLLFYGLAAVRGNPGTKISLSFVHLRDGRVKPLAAADSWTDLEQDVEAAAEQAAEGPFPPAGENCPTCPWRKECPHGQR